MFILLTEIIKKQFIIGVEKRLIGGKPETLTWGTQIQEALELCSMNYKMGWQIQAKTARSINCLLRIRISHW